MNLRVLFQSLAVYLPVALVTYGLSGYLSKAFQVDSALIGDASKLIALAVGGSFVTAMVYPHLRGVKSGDQLVAMVQREHVHAGVRKAVMDVVFVTALEGGKVGHKIRVAMSNGFAAEGIITSYAGTLTPPVLKITEAEISE